MPNDQHDEGADRRTEEPGALIGSIPTDALADPGGNECAGDAEPGGQKTPLRVVRSGQEEAGDDTRNQTDQYDPDEAGHGTLLVPFRACTTERSAKGSGATSTRPGSSAP